MVSITRCKFDVERVAPTRYPFDILYTVIKPVSNRHVEARLQDEVPMLAGDELLTAFPCDGVVRDEMEW